MKSILLIRHGTVERAYKGAYIGKRDVSLGQDKKKEINHLAEAIRPYRPDIIVCSPLQRAKQTAEGVAGILDFPHQKIKVYPFLQEIDFGRWDGLTFPEIVAADPELVDQWNNWSEDFCFPQGERIGDFLIRIKGITEQLLQIDYESVLVVSHGGVIRAMICYLLGLEPENYLLFDIKPASLAVLKMYDGGAVLSGLNLGVL